MKKSDDDIMRTWEWLFSDKEFEDGETFDIHLIMNVFTGEIKQIVTKRIEVKENKKERIVREG